MTRQATRPVKDTIARNLDAAIVASGRTNRDVGESVGVTEHAVWRWRRGKVVPSTPYLKALARELFGGDLSALYAEHDDGHDDPKTEAA